MNLIRIQLAQRARMKRFSFFLCIFIPAFAFGSPEVQSGPAVGATAPDFKVRNVVTGEDVSLSSQRGKVVILTFWASWCTPCKRELPILEGAQRAVSKDKLVVLAVNYRDTDAALVAIKKPAVNWQINIMKDHDGHVASLYSISTIPHLFMIGRDGKIVANHLGYGERTLDEPLADINHALAAPPAEAR